MGLSARQRWAWAGAWLVTASAAFLLVAAELERYPVSAWLWLAGILVPAAAAGFVLDYYRYCLLCLVYFPLVLVAAHISENPVGVLAAPFVPVAAALPMAIGVIARHRLRTTVTTAVSVLAGACLTFAFVPVVHAYVEKHRTVRVHGSRPLIIDEQRGSVAGVALDDPVTRVKAVLGEPPRSDPNRGIGALDDHDDFWLGPQSIPGLKKREHPFAYPKLFFMADDRVRYLQVIDRRARLSRGVGVGDSMSLVRRAYPELKCDEGSAGSDEPVPYPECVGRTGPGVYLYVSGDYSKPGTPAAQIWLADFRI